MKYYARERRLCDFFFLSLNNRFFLLQFISKEINVTLYFFFFKKKNLSNLSSITHTHIRTSLKFYSKSKIQRRSRIKKVFNRTLFPVFIVQRETDNEPLKIPSLLISRNHLRYFAENAQAESPPIPLQVGIKYVFPPLSRTRHVHQRVAEFVRLLTLDKGREASGINIAETPATTTDPLVGVSA